MPGRGKRSNQKYHKKSSGQIIDRVEIWVEVSKITYDKLVQKEESQDIQHTQIKNIISHMRSQQYKQFGTLIGRMSTKELTQYITISKEIKDFYDVLAIKFQISARSYTNILKVALTISLLDNQNQILREHILEALSYRPQEGFTH